MSTNSRTAGGLIVGRSIFAAGTTRFNGVTGAAGTILPVSGQIKAAGGISAGGTITAGATLRGTVVRASTGFYFVQGNSKLFASGTYIGTGGATAAITSTGLTTIHGVEMYAWTKGYASATTLARNVPRPAIANGTVGSFYPLIYRTAATNKNVQLGIGSGATFKWFAFGA